MSAPRPVADVYPVLRQWAFVAYECTSSLEAALLEFLRARSDLNSWRLAVPVDVWFEGGSAADLEYEASIFRIQGASFFLISAARQVVRVLDADPALGQLPGSLHSQVHQMRNVVEHWDEWTEDKTRRGSRTSAARLRDTDPEAWPFGFKFTSEMDFLVGGTISFSQLQDVFTALWLW